MNNLGRNLSVLGMLSFVVCMGVVLVCNLLNKDPIGWITLVIGSGFGLAITIIASAGSEKMLSLLTESEKEKKSHAAFIVKDNFLQIKKLTDDYESTVNKPTILISEKRKALLSILPSIKIFLNICEISLPNVGNRITKDILKEISTRFIIVHKLLVILESGSDKQFDINIPKLTIRINEINDYLINKL